MPTMQDTSVFTKVTISVRLDEIDYLGHVSPSSYLNYIGHARARLAEQQKVDFLAWVKKGIRVVVVNDTLDYRHPATYGDLLDVICWVAEIGDSSVKFGFRITEQKTEKAILQATSSLVCIDPSGKATSIPEEVRRAFS